MTTLSDASFPPGTVITGKWNRSRYTIRKLLGRGANGVVFLVQLGENGKHYALKMGFDPVDLQSEINVLKSFQLQRNHEALRQSGIPSYLKDVDDYAVRDRDIPFYVMRYVRGEALHHFIRRQGTDWTMLIGARLLQRLAQLHRAGWVFGDLKPQNVLVSDYGHVELIDYGGVTSIGRSVKQFTEWYDRGFWNAGSRTADATYDVFAFALLMIHILEGDALKSLATDGLPQLRNVNQLVLLVEKSERLGPFRQWIIRALRGQFKDADHAAKLWKELMARPTPMRRRSRSNTPRWLKNAFALSVILLIGALIYALRF
ncbi:putative serine/threonine-protein kinase YabT [Paenibacillus sp. JJ-100]|uniref:serine/threonine protein kinase n=1 Tax=unclassified Paenibacillus TaxID=185978 RepID=UPI0022FF5BDE|nr:MULTISPECIES: protein kinase [unclassified Paenibacillus]MBR2563177.1 serine/threonine protein kinase [Paenibacillus sp.]CAI6085931.1 putative serine/threonine-protein kinase YabT [Paenibacillus sp. JJ-100]